MAKTNRWTERVTSQLWARFRQRLSFKQIVDGLGICTTTAWKHIASHGGFPPPVRKRRQSALTEAEREEISLGVAADRSIRSIAAQLDRAPSTICRELQRNGGRLWYRAVVAEARARDQVRRPQRCKLAREQRLQRAVACKLLRRWSPQQVAAWLRRRYADDDRMRVSHETIYRSLFIQARGAFRDELRGYLRQHRHYRRPRGGEGAPRASFDGVSISERPAEVDDRAVPGHWEGDLLLGTIDSYIVTLVERKTRYVLLAKVASKETQSVMAALAKAMRRLPTELRKSLTLDRGAEFRAHKQFALDAGLDVYFCDPYSPWQRGSNENTNGLLRQYFPKGDNLSKYDQRQLDRVARELNGRPRETLGWRTPAEVLNELLP